jgi:oligogalacturonide lyase
MNKILLSAACIAAALLPHPCRAQADPPASAPASSAIPDEYNDPDTGARILHLSKGIDGPAGVIYFTQACISPDGRYALVRNLVPTAGHTAGLMYRYDFKTGNVVKLTDRMTKNQGMAAKSGNIYYTSDNDTAIYVTNIYDMKTRKLADMPAGMQCGGGGLTINANETLVAGVGTYMSGTESEPVSTVPPNQGPQFDNTFEQHDAYTLVTADTKTGEVKIIHKIDTWLDHAQFSPTDPDLLLYSHEGPWDKVDRIWTIRISDTTPQLVLKRTVDGEIAGHEFWGVDGSTVWYDHNFRGTPGGKHYLEGKNLATGAITQYPITAPFGSIHYVQSPDGKYFVCDGGANRDPSLQAMYALVPDNGKLDPVKLCSMAKNNYKDAEPNPHLTPDQHWDLFTATFSGISKCYAVEMPKQFWR